MPKSRPQKPDSITGPVTAAQARAEGLERWQLRDAGLHRIHRDLWVPSDQAGDLSTRCAAALRMLPDGSAVSHLTAARLRGLPVPAPLPDEPVHALVPAAKHPRVEGIHVHRVRGPYEAVELRSGLLVAGAARTWADLAPYLNRDDLVVLGDSMLNRNLTTRQLIGAELEAGRGRRGVSAARAVLALLEPKADSPGETRTRLLLIDKGIGGFVVNEVIRDEDGEWLCRPDIHFQPPMVLLEYQGEHHFADPRQRRRDIRKHEVMRDRGWTVLEIVSADLHRERRKLTATRIRDAVERRTRRTA